MNRNDVDWKGYWAATTTPFARDGAFDEPAWRELLQLQVRQGMHGIVVNGTTGEWYSQTDDERRRMAEIAVREVGGQMTVVIGCTTFTAAHTCELARHAHDIGADGVLATPPPYAAPSHDEIVHFYSTISERVPIPLMVYNFPRGTALEIPARLARRLADIPNVVAIKNSTPNKIGFFETLEAVVDKIRVFGMLFLTPPGIAAQQHIGGDGSIGGGCLLGAELPEFWNSIWRGDVPRAREIAAKYSKVSSELVSDEVPCRG